MNFKGTMKNLLAFILVSTFLLVSVFGLNSGPVAHGFQPAHKKSPFSSFKAHKTFKGQHGSASDNLGDFDEIMVKFKPLTDESEILLFNSTLGVKQVNKIKKIGIQHIKIPSDKSSEEILSAYREANIVEFAEPNYTYRASVVPNDTRFSEQWNLSIINANLAWDVTVGSPKVIVAVIDSGIDYNHSDLSANVWNNSDEVPGNGIDDDKNGFVDDYRGWNFVANDNDPTDDDPNGHGTHVSGIIAAVTNNNLGVAGLNWRCSLMPLKALDYTGYGLASDIADAIVYATDNGADVINISLGDYNHSETVLEAIEYAHQRGCILVASSGNDGLEGVSYPAAYPYVIAAGATNSSDSIASYSDYGNEIDVSAPGGSVSQGILSTTKLNTYGYMIGTSMASPHVAGLAALIRSIYPTLTARQVERQIESTCDDKGITGWDKFYGFGRVNAQNATVVSPNLVDDNYEPNDTLNTAHPIIPGTYYAKMQKYGDDFDIYKFTISNAPQDIYITLSDIPAGSDYDLELQDSNGFYLDYSAETGNSNESINYFLSAPGTYYIIVSVFERSGNDNYQYCLCCNCSEPNLSYSDVLSSHWAYDYIEYLTAQGVISGYSDGTFRPSNNIKRAEFAKVICEAQGWDLLDPEISSFPDVSKTHWAYQYIETAKAYGAIGGYEDGTFKPDDYITRAEISKMITISAGLTINASGTPFPDVSTFYWAYQYIMTCRNNNIIDGYDDGTFKSSNSASRAEASTMIYRMLIL